MKAVKVEVQERKDGQFSGRIQMVGWDYDDIVRLAAAMKPNFPAIANGLLKTKDDANV